MIIACVVLADSNKKTSHIVLKDVAVIVREKHRFRREQSGGKKSKKEQEKRQKRFAYLCIFALVFSGVLKEPNLRFESASLTSSKRLFDELIKAL